MTDPRQKIIVGSKSVKSLYDWFSEIMSSELVGYVRLCWTTLGNGL